MALSLAWLLKEGMKGDCFYVGGGTGGGIQDFDEVLSACSEGEFVHLIS